MKLMTWVFPRCSTMVFHLSRMTLFSFLFSSAVLIFVSTKVQEFWSNNITFAFKYKIIQKQFITCVQLVAYMLVETAFNTRENSIIQKQKWNQLTNIATKLVEFSSCQKNSYISIAIGKVQKVRGKWVKMN